MKNFNPDLIRNVIAFLYENEQYGDCWAEEIAELEKILEYAEMSRRLYDVIAGFKEKGYYTYKD